VAQRPPLDANVSRCRPDREDAPGYGLRFIVAWRMVGRFVPQTASPRRRRSAFSRRYGFVKQHHQRNRHQLRG
jgi:hypothetical protein